MEPSTKHTANAAHPLLTIVTRKLSVLDVYHSDNAKQLRTIDLSSGSQVCVQLLHEWADTEVSNGVTIGIVLTASPNKYDDWLPVFSADIPVQLASDTIAVTRDANYLIVDPDTLISSTVVADSFLCLRKSVINARAPVVINRGRGLDSPALFGSMIHSIVQTLLQAQFRSPSRSLNVGTDEFLVVILETIEQVLNDYGDHLYAADIPISTARDALHTAVPQIDRWFFDAINGPAPNSDRKRQPPARPHPRITDVADIEELIWSPTFGLKGKIDASVHLVQDTSAPVVAPLELKTGSSSGVAGNSHSAQVMLYALQMTERYRRPVRTAMISYLRYDRTKLPTPTPPPGTADVDMPNRSTQPPNLEMEIKMVSANRASISGLLMQRNKLAAFIRINRHERLPSLLQDSERICAKCFVNHKCMMLHKLVEGGTLQSARSGPGEKLFQEKTQHLDARHASYYSLWRDILLAEERAVFESQSDLWAMSSLQRESYGKCIANLKLIATEAHDNDSQTGNSRGKRFRVSFQRSSSGPALTTASLPSGAYVIVSAEIDRFDVDSQEMPKSLFTAVTTAFIQLFDGQKVHLAADADLNEWARVHIVDLNKVKWRIDASEMASSYNLAKDALDDLFCSPDLQQLRELIVEGRPPRFDNEVHGRDVSKDIALSLNEDQQRAFCAAQRLRDYLLILGMPGTGKTTTLAAIVKSFVERGKSVLLCSYTNAAVDNLLLALVRLGCEDFIRLGRNRKAIHSRIHKYHESNLLNTEIFDEENWEKVYSKPSVVATTCLGMNHPLFGRRSNFDVVVVDEASQILQPVCISPLRFSKGPFILVGDHYQLPPLVTADNARRSSTGNVDGQADGGKQGSESLFRRLCQLHPETVVSLRRQYRMCKEIMDLGNHIVYSGNLMCGTPATGGTFNTFPGADLGTFERKLLDPARAVFFLNTALSTPAPKSRRRGAARKSDMTETEAVVKVTKLFLAHGVGPDDISILSPYRAQVEAISKRLRDENINVSSFTVDQFQGKENTCVIASIVSNEPNAGLLSDWRRLNVLVTRAKRKLVIVGSSAALENDGHTLKNLMSYFQRNDMVYPLSLL
eukprot:GFKZ01000570.1.p1 GENE.GFKZ01000570.1~~GFKZ01000570.1.p1  ORF type:complete len:1088 (-),score=149.69 GFKZ01000570.1:2237-5500(-)